MTTKTPDLALESVARRSRMSRDPLRDAFFLAGGIYLALILLGVVDGGPDGRAYWVNRLPDPYAEAAYGSESGFYYSPAIAQMLAPFTLLTWPQFHALLVAASLGSLWWMLGRWSVVALLFPPVAIELYSANINLVIAAAVVAGFRYPGTWAFPILTKVAPAIGLLWFAIRRQWRDLAIAVGTTAAIVGVSFVLSPDLWREWVGILTGNVGMPAPELALQIPLAIRLPIAVVVVVAGALTDRRWMVPIAVTLAMPILWPAQLSILVAMVPLRPRGTFPRLGRIR